MKQFMKKRHENRSSVKKPSKRRKSTASEKHKRLSKKAKLQEENSDVELDILSDSESEGDGASEPCSETEDDAEENCHVPPESLEVASDESDFEKDEKAEVPKSGKMTLQMVNALESEFNSNRRSMKPVSGAVRAFHGCLMRISGDASENDTSGYRIDGSAVFNAVIRMCVTSIYPYLKKLLNLPSNGITKNQIEGSKRWPAAKNTVRGYIADLVKLIANVSSDDILRVLLKHLHQMTPFAACLPTISKPLIKRIITLWSSSNDDTIRVISFLCILRFAACDLTSYLHTVLKKMYFSYISNCKFVSANTVVGINFMRKSLAEMFSLNDTVTYKHAFLYIRQLAIHLRSAVTLKQKDSIQAVYNWQFISSLRLWVDVLCAARDKKQLNSLIYPTIQIIIGCIKLIPTAQYLPLRFHCVEMLITFTKEIGIFIPVLPFLIEALSILKVNSQHKKLSMKPMDFTYMLRLSKAQLQENAFKDAVIGNVYDCMLQYTTFESHRISFPETVVVLQIHLKQFLKECKNSNYTRKFKPLLEKIVEVSALITSQRNGNGISISDEKSISAWEATMKAKSNSLISFYDSWAKLNEQKNARKITEKIEILPKFLKMKS